MFTRFVACILCAAGFQLAAAESTGPTDSTTLRIATFDIDATPPIGSHMAYDPVTNAQITLSRPGAGPPIATNTGADGAFSFARRTLEQADAQSLFQRLELTGERGLRQMEPFSSAR